MKTFSTILFFLLAILLSSVAQAQITNFLMNGSSTSFTMTSGDTLTWSFDIPNGGTAFAEIWYDLNHNGTIESATDKEYIIFSQTDGDNSGNGGPPDLDGLVNGHVFFSLRVGLAPGNYVVRFSHNGSSVKVTGTINPLASPAHTISGHITPPPGKSAQYVFVNMESSNNSGPGIFWDGMTDASGDYTIAMDADTAGNPWRIRLQNNPFPPAITLPQDTLIVITGNHTGYNFICYAAAAQVAGSLQDDNGSPLLNSGAYITRNDISNFYRNGRPGANGIFQIGLLASELISSSWTLQSEMNNGGGNYVTTTELQARIEIPAIIPTDSLFYVLKIYKTNSTVRGQVLFNGGPVGHSLQVTAVNPDTAISYGLSDSATGFFTLQVSDKIRNYHIRANWIPYDWSVPDIIVHPGDSNIVVNITQQTWANNFHGIGWNMLALPLIVPDARKTTVFPSASTSAYTFASPGGYRIDTLLQYGKGYWLKYPDTNSTWFNGYVISRETLAVTTGWNMIAPPTYGMNTGNIVPMGTTITTQYYGYSNGYYTTTYLNGGYGYWVKVNQPGSLIVNNSAASPLIHPRIQTNGEAVNEQDAGWQRLSFTDAAGQKRSLYLSTSQSGLDPSTFELPPLPPAGIMDVRYSSGRMLECPIPNSAVMYQVMLTSAVYPLTISLESGTQAHALSVIIDGREHGLAIGNSAVVPDEHSSVAIRVNGTEGTVPEKFMLLQNYPNPFNPTTVIRYALAVHGWVTLRVFDVLGQQVAVLVDRIEDAGYKSVEWNAINVPSGVYYFRLTAGSYTEIKKMMLIK